MGSQVVEVGYLHEGFAWNAARPVIDPARPSTPWRSTSATWCPSWAARKAAVYPPADDDLVVTLEEQDGIGYQLGEPIQKGAQVAAVDKTVVGRH